MGWSDRFRNETWASSQLNKVIFWPSASLKHVPIQPETDRVKGHVWVDIIWWEA